MLELADGSFVYLQGRIDRVDMAADGAVRIIDYKSGGKKFDPTLVYWGCSCNCCCIWRQQWRVFQDRVWRDSSIAESKTRR